MSKVEKFDVTEKTETQRPNFELAREEFRWENLNNCLPRFERGEYRHHIESGAIIIEEQRDESGELALFVVRAGDTNELLLSYDKNARTELEK